MDRLWWNHITKAHKFLEDIISSALDGKSMILCLPENVPWRDTLLELVEDRLKLENPKNALDRMQCPEEEVGLFLLNRYCKAERRATYRFGMTYAEFLGKCEDTVLNDRYLWVSGISKNRYDEWISFIVEYRKNVRNKTPGVFILETQDDGFANRAGKGMKKLIFDHQIGAYDKFAFCALAASDRHCREYLRPYLADLVSTVCNRDIELCAECVLLGNAFLENSIQVIRDIVREKCRSNGKNYCFPGTEEEIRTKIWETQLKNIFPVIEKYRSSFIRKYRKYIDSALPITTSYGEQVVNPEDVEIGALVYMVGNGKIPLESREYETLVVFREARNRLAHLNMLEPDAVDLILRKGNLL